MLFVLAIALFVYWKLLRVLIKRLARTIGWTTLRRWLPSLMMGFGWLTVLIGRIASDWISLALIITCSLINLPIVVAAAIIRPEPSWQMAVIATFAVWLIWYATVNFIESRAAETIKIFGPQINADKHR